MAFITLQHDITIHYTCEGIRNGFPLVFINSLGTDLRIWDQIVPSFKDSYQIIRYDKRGHGLSDCPPPPYTIRKHATDLAHLLDYLAVKQAILVGISVGGMIALDFAAAWPTRVRSLILSDTGAKIGTAVMWDERITTLRQHGMNHLKEAILSRWFAPSFRKNEPASYRGYGNMLTRTPVTGYTGTCEAIRDADLTKAAQATTIPTLLLCGTEDLATPPALVRNLYELMPNASYQEITGAAHLPCIEQPDIMTAQIKQLL